MITNMIMEEYLRKVYEPLVRYVKQEVGKGGKIAFWGAGKKGEDFLKIVDKDNIFISYIFDKDESKWGGYIQTGHKIVDYKKYKVDIVIVSGSNIILETRYRLRQLPYTVRIINLDDIVVGNFNLIKKQDYYKKTVNYDNKIAAMVILFHPNVAVLENIKSYIKEVDWLFLYDNSPYSNMELFSDIIQDYKCVYLYANGHNDGLGKPINVIAKIAANNGADWLFTFDQDSKAESDMVARMRYCVNSGDFDDNIGILAPMIISPNDYFDGIEYASNESFVMYVRNVIQSGTLINLCIFKKVGEYYENLFIDYVDFEYCLRLRSKGYKIARLSNAKLIHQVDSDYRVCNLNGKKFFLGKYSPLRYYYQYRNILYCMSKYRYFDPVFARSCEKKIVDLELAAQIDDNKYENLNAISKARMDYTFL